MEIGTWKGDFAAQLLRRTRPTRLYLVDPWEYDETFAWTERATRNWLEKLIPALFAREVPGGPEKADAVYQGVLDRFSRQIARGQVAVLRVRSTEPSIQIDEVDWVYVDGDHSHDVVKSDLESFYPRLKPGGVMAGDDYGTPGWWNDGVRAAVDEFAASRGLDVTIIGSQFLFKKPL